MAYVYYFLVVIPKQLVSVLRQTFLTLRGWAKILNSVLIVFSTALFLYLGILPHLNLDIKIIKISKVQGESENNIPTPSPEKEIVSDCTSPNNLFCSDFSNMERDFDELNTFTVDRDNPRILKVNLPKDGDKDNSNLWAKLQLGPEFDFMVRVKLQDEEKGNLTIAYGQDWRCIIGEEGFNAITCESNYNNIKKIRRKKTYLTSLNRPKIQPGEELTVDGIVSLQGDTGLKIKLHLEYFGQNGKKIDDVDIYHELEPSSLRPKDDKKRFGVGIIDPEDETIRVEFLKLEVKQ